MERDTVWNAYCLIGRKVGINHGKDIEGIIIGLFITENEIQYEVAYTDKGDRKTPYLYDSEFYIIQEPLTIKK